MDDTVGYYSNNSARTGCIFMNKFTQSEQFQDRASFLIEILYGSVSLCNLFYV